MMKRLCERLRLSVVEGEARRFLKMFPASVAGDLPALLERLPLLRWRCIWGFCRINIRLLSRRLAVNWDGWAGEVVKE